MLCLKQGQIQWKYLIEREVKHLMLANAWIIWTVPINAVVFNHYRNEMLLYYTVSSLVVDSKLHRKFFK